MRKKLLGLVAALGVWGIGLSDECQAQTIFLPPQPNPAGRPLGTPYYNPYYNPFRPGGVNIGVGRPGIDTTPALFGVQPLLTPGQTAFGVQPLLTPGQTAGVYQDQLAGLPVTGHPYRFFNYSHYYYYPLVGGAGLGYGTAGPGTTGLLTSTPRPAVAQGATTTNTAGQPPKPTAK
jgi:hypothetical protein